MPQSAHGSSQSAYVVVSCSPWSWRVVIAAGCRGAVTVSFNIERGCGYSLVLAKTLSVTLNLAPIEPEPRKTFNFKNTRSWRSSFHTEGRSLRLHKIFGHILGRICGYLSNYGEQAGKDGKFCPR